MEEFNQILNSLFSQPLKVDHWLQMYQHATDLKSYN